VAQGAVESGIGVATSYPGAPATEIMESLIKSSRRMGFHAQWSVNEKVAFEIAAGAAFNNVRSICVMKHLGANVMMDSLNVVAYSGVKAGLVVVVADDPGGYSSQNAVDSRLHAIMAKIPCIEPTCGQEAKDMVSEAFGLSERFSLPVILRLTPRICHSNFEVMVKATVPPLRKPSFSRDPQYLCIPPRTNLLHERLNEKQGLLLKHLRKFKFNRVSCNGAQVGIVASGFSYNYVMEAVNVLGMRTNVLKLATTNPIPPEPVIKLVKSSKQVLIVEELEPIVEDFVKTIRNTGIHGKDLLPRSGELSTELVAKALCAMTGKRNPFTRRRRHVDDTIPSLCIGCPHRASYYALNKVLRSYGGEYVVAGDRGCYNLGAHKPLVAIDTCLSMGSSIGIAQGFFHSGFRGKIVAVIGDSTFFHNGVNALLNAGHNRANLTVIVLDNEWTSMTGHQPNPGTGIDCQGTSTKRTSIADMARVAGADMVLEANPYDVRGTISALKSAINAGGLSVVVLSQTCALKAGGKRIGEYYVTGDCNGCMHCINAFGCPVMSVSEGGVVIDPRRCTGCGVCVSVCAAGCIRKR